ncbi:hypothetical protein Y1Q_0016165 [Alligator mississippiensis]|uniref:Uncharacterized protein n=1 Tax=Alligator mississippiensis TaxID=8496 RepID=A0A151P0Y8_ALLMI|nr:hypothetical protein Y1Q_0016165 [Alligator mississippiensis]
MTVLDGIQWVNQNESNSCFVPESVSKVQPTACSVNTLSSNQAMKLTSCGRIIPQKLSSFLTRVLALKLG